MFHPDDPYHGQVFQLLLFRCMLLETWVRSRLFIFSTWAAFLAVSSLAKDKKHERAHLAILYNVCYIFVYTLYKIDEKER